MKTGKWPKTIELKNAVTKAQVERERAELKSRLQRINLLAGSLRRASITTYDCRELLRLIEEVSEANQEQP